MCKTCPQGSKGSVEHMILLCVGRAAFHRKTFGRMGGNTAEELCRDNPLEVLRILKGKKLLEENFKR